LSQLLSFSEKVSLSVSHQYHLDVSGRPRRVFNGASRFADSVWIAHLAFLDAGLTKESVNGRNIGVFVGSMPGEMVSASPSDVLENYQNVYTLTGTNHSIAAARISYVLGLTGPCAVYSAAGSSSLIALHSVVRSLEANDCEMAIVLGVNICFCFVVKSLREHDADGYIYVWDVLSRQYLLAGKSRGCVGFILVFVLSKALMFH
jgi:hypothetical protein